MGGWGGVGGTVSLDLRVSKSEIKQIFTTPWSKGS